MRFRSQRSGQPVHAGRSQTSALGVLIAIVFGLLVPTCGFAGTIQVTGPSAAGPYPVNSGGVASQWEITRDPGMLDWVGTVSNHITFQSGDERAKLVAFNAPSLGLTGSDLNKYFDAGWSTKGPNSGSHQITGVWTVDWTWSPSFPGNPSLDQSTVSHSVTVSVVGYVPEPSSLTLATLGTLGAAVLTWRRARI